ncbi:anionic trypsin-like [Stylophora pistillata]|uniref:anionic trypsin-like n=1 Tax=Stylophora pistillata TaxID=50429 RepID=UPI000C04370B|nr:anionic trypsin-like [Stylophora pistillata]
MRMKLLLFAAFLAGPVGRIYGFYCNFDRNQCGFVQRRDDEFDWTRKKGATSSGSTGPYSDVKGRGYYMYIEASRKSKDDNAKLEILPGIAAGKTCISFFYHMRGGQMGTLRVLVDGKQVFEKSGHQGFDWRTAQFTVERRASSIVFEGIVGRGHQSDIAIDEVKIDNCGEGGGGQATIKPPAPQPQTARPPLPHTATPPTSECGFRPSTRIVGGEYAPPGAWPWQAMLRWSHTGYVFCGGSLVAPQWVVTASHCVAKAGGDPVYIRLGAHKQSESMGTEQDFTASKVILHPFYHKPIGMSHDIALLKLDRPAVLTRQVNLVCLPHSIPAPPEGTKCWITGWGKTASVGGSSGKVLKQATVPIVGRNRCEWSYLGQIHDSMICAGLDRGGVDSCQGDSGGPMVCETGGKFYLQGVTSWGKGCGRPNKYGVYARVTYLLEWLKKEMARN